MQPELYFFEQWLREQHANIRADVRAARLRPQLDYTARDVDAVPVWKDIGSSFLKLGATSFGGIATWG